MNKKLRILSVGSVVPGGDIRYPRGYGRVILGSLASLQALGHEVSYVQLGGTEKISKVSCNLVIGNKKFNVQAIRLPVQNTQSQKNNFFWYASHDRWKLLGDAIKSSLGYSPEVVISEANAQFYFGAIIASQFNAAHILRIHSIRGLYLRQILESKQSASSKWILKEALQCPISIAYTSALAHRSSYAITLTPTEEIALRKTLITNVSTVEPTYVQFSEEERAPALNLGRQYVMIMQGDPSLILKGITTDIPIVLVGESTKYLENNTKPSSRGNITVTGKITNEELASHIKGAAMIASPRIYTSGVGIGIIEALAYGKATITTSIAASKLAGLENGKHLIVEDDFSKWPSIMSDILANSNRRLELETNAKRYFDEFLRPDTHSARFEGILTRIISN